VEYSTVSLNYRDANSTKKFENWGQMYTMQNNDLNQRWHIFTQIVRDGIQFWFRDQIDESGKSLFLIEGVDLENLAISKISTIAPESEISGYSVIERLLSSPQFKLQPQVNFIYRMRLDFAKYSLTEIAQIPIE
jgi:hypothetical protein